MTEQTWVGALDQLLLDVDALVDQFMQILAPDPAYGQSSIPFSELRAVDREVFVALIQFLIDPVANRGELKQLASDLGARRANDGIPLENLVAAIRLDFSILWSALSNPKYGLPAEIQVAHGQRVWEAVEIYTAQVHMHYSEALRAKDQLDRETVLRNLALLFGDSAPGQADMARIAGTLRIDENANFRLLAVNRTDLPSTLQRLAPRVPGRIYGQELAHQAVVFWETKAPAWQDLTAEESLAVSVVPCAVAPIARGVGELRSAAVIAREVLSDLPVGLVGPHTPLDRWRTIAHHRMALVGCDPRSMIARKLERVPETDRERLLQTARTYLRTGSLSITAEREYCHRNTVINRLDSFANLTGIDVRQPSGAALGLLALDDQ
ncbi:helix-turn-helix domain-containing protein [Paeniglutamicibacter sp. NPDC012692]|uniref:helix-turn-helix domain-containing protein n=1 Tax=Paeniglutamicibacter sp. NPDC012692 TaxID=3364388 RepID=UPI003679678B